MKSHCKTCPFKPIDGVMQDVRLANKVTASTLFKGHQICHGTEGKGRKPNNRCKGSFDQNMQIYERMGLFELAARHTIAREHRFYPTCRLMEAAVMKLPHSEQIIVSRLNYYVPVGDGVLELFGK